MAHSRGIPEPSEYGKFARRILRGYGRRVGDADPEDLADLIALAGEVDALISTTIHTGRARWGWTWEDIGRAAGVGRSAAFQRWAQPKVPDCRCNASERRLGHRDDCAHQGRTRDIPWPEAICGYANCQRGAVTEYRLPDGTTGVYCGEHGPIVVERNRRRLARNTS